MTNKINSIFALGILILVSMACSFNVSTANLSDLKFGKDKNASGADTSFKPEDEIFAVTAVNNTSDKNKVKYRMLVEKVEGAQTGTVAYKFEKESEIEGSRPIWFTFSVPGGFVPGSYKVEVVLTGEDGKEFDRKTGSFTIAGGNTDKTAKPAAPSADDTKTETGDNKGSDDK